MIRTMLCFVLTGLLANTSWSDTIANYLHISQSIPKMELKADAQSQTWARSARYVLTITNESIAETLIALNEQAAKQGRPFFCLPKNKKLDAEYLGQLIDEAGQKLAQPSNINQTTVSQIALQAVVNKYPCRTVSRNAFTSLSQTHAAMQHAETAP